MYLDTGGLRIFRGTPITPSTQDFTILADGNVGIGTTVPSYKLDVVSSDHKTIKAESTGNDRAEVLINKSGGTARSWSLAVAGSANGYSVADKNFYIADTTGGAARLVINNSGNVGIGTSTPSYTLEVNGSFGATTKSFIIDHPTKPDKKLQYGSLEGPEHSVYLRGRSKYKVIDLPDYWPELVHEDSITVQLTSVGKHQSLYVEKIENNKVYINSNKVGEILNYFYNIYAERKDVAKLEVEIDK